MPNSKLKLAELIGALSHALDITEGQPPGHCVRCCWIGISVGKAVGLADKALWDLYYTLLLKDLGCSSNAARISELYLTDDLAFKRDFKWVDGSLPQVLRFVVGHTGLQAGLLDRFRATLTIFQEGDRIAQELIETRCMRGADIARQLGFDEAVALGVHGLDEHWDGSGRPARLAGEQIPLNARIALMAQVVDVFHTVGGPDAALDEIMKRSGTWFDPALVTAFCDASRQPGFWNTLASEALPQAVFAQEPAQCSVEVTEAYLDDIAVAFGQIVDAKSPYTAGHSARVAAYTDILAAGLGLPDERRNWLRRGALLHDLGKLGVSNAVLDKPGKLDGDEWASVQRHAAFTEEILGRMDAFSELARISGAHHERLDGKGYPRGISGASICLETRIITTADIFDAISSERPYRGAIPVGRTLEMMQEHVGTAIDSRCFDALCAARDQLETLAASAPGHARIA